MTKLQRVTSFMSGLILIALSLFMLIDHEMGSGLVALALGISMMAAGIGYLGFYVFMARHMVGGKAMLYKGLIVLDIGMLTIAVSDSSQIYVMLYLAGSYLFGGIIRLLRGMEAKKMESPSWKLTASIGAVNILAAVLCLIFIRSHTVLVYIYCAGLLYTACVKIISAFRKTEIVYIQ